MVRGGGGIYYNSSLSIATDTVNGGPLNLAQHSSSIHAPFPSLLSYGFLPDLTLPSVAQWSAFLDHAIGARDVLSAGYVGSTGRDLLRREMGGPGSSATVWVALATNHGSADYHALQLQYRRRFAHGLQGLISYSWSHSIDNSSSDSMIYWAGSGGAERDRGRSDFDLRHSASAAFTAELPKGWALDGVVRARTGFPITVTDTETVSRVDPVGGVPSGPGCRAAPMDFGRERAGRAPPERRGFSRHHRHQAGYTRA